MTKDDGGPAFARSGYVFNQDDVANSQEGMSLRDWFAAMALQGICARLTDEKILDMSNGFLGAAIPAQAAYIFADAMLKERNRD